jgi:hypothetical protein
MPTQSDNPVFDRMTRGSGWPSRKVAQRIGLGLGVTGTVASIVLILQPEPEMWMIMGITALFDAAVVLAGACALLSFAIPAISTARQVADESFALLRMTTLQPEMTVAGMVAAPLYRLRVLQFVARWFLPAGAVGMALMLGPTGMGNIFRCTVGGVCQNPYQMWVISGAPVPMLIIGLGVMVFPRVMQSLSVTGIWLGLKWPGAMPWLAGGALLTGAIAALVMIWATQTFFFFSAVQTVCVYLPLWGYWVLMQVSKKAARETISYVAGYGLREHPGTL